MKKADLDTALKLTRSTAFDSVPAEQREALARVDEATPQFWSSLEDVVDNRYDREFKDFLERCVMGDLQAQDEDNQLRWDELVEQINELDERKQPISAELIDEWVRLSYGHIFRDLWVLKQAI